MKSQGKYIFHFVVILSLVAMFGSCTHFVLQQSNARMAVVAEVNTVLSLLECAVMVENNNKTVAFSYNSENKTCELSETYPEGENMLLAENWEIFQKIVNGGWTDWTAWSACTPMPDAIRSRTRTCSNPAPGNGGQPCAGASLTSEICHRLTCFNDSNMCVGDYVKTWDTARAECEAANASLVIFENMGDIDYLATKLSAFYHWIGMTCAIDNTCEWINGTSVTNEMSSAWAKNEPNQGGCVWIGLYNDQLDDTYCSNLYPFICEY